MDKLLESRDYKVENKKFFFDLKENVKGRYLRITESSGGRSAIVVPEAGLKSFSELVAAFVAILEKSEPAVHGGGGSGGPKSGSETGG
jgi:hypothetical protein